MALRIPRWRANKGRRSDFGRCSGRGHIGEVAWDGDEGVVMVLWVLLIIRFEWVVGVRWFGCGGGLIRAVSFGLGRCWLAVRFAIVHCGLCFLRCLDWLCVA